MRKLVFKAVAISMLLVSFSSCESDEPDTPWVAPQITTTGAYILNTGSSGKQNANFAYYDLTSGTLTQQVFANENNEQLLGDTGQDMVIYGSKMYITVTASNKIYVTNLKGKVLNTISPLNSSNQPQEPRSVIANGGKVYVSLYDGYVMRIDTVSMNEDKKVQVGKYPEQMTISNNKLYVTNSGWGLEKTVSVIDIASFIETKKIEVVVNPTRITSDSYNNVYVISMGNYYDILPSLQKIDATTDLVVKTLGVDIATIMAVNKDRLLFVGNSYGSETTSIGYYDIKNDQVVTEKFFKNPTSMVLKDISEISIDPTNSNIYLFTSDYRTNGSMYLFSVDGTFKTALTGTIGTGGLNPAGAYFLTKTEK